MVAAGSARRGASAARQIEKQNIRSEMGQLLCGIRGEWYGKTCLGLGWDQENVHEPTARGRRRRLAALELMTSIAVVAAANL